MPEVVHHAELLGKCLHLVAFLVESEVIMEEVGELQGH